MEVINLFLVPRLCYPMVLPSFFLNSLLLILAEVWPLVPPNTFFFNRKIAGILKNITSQVNVTKQLRNQ